MRHSKGLFFIIFSEILVRVLYWEYNLVLQFHQKRLNRTYIHLNFKSKLKGKISFFDRIKKLINRSYLKNLPI